jgi:hypothetical protein
MRAMQKIWDLQSQFKEDICNILINKYKELHDGLLPKWEDENVVLTENEIDEVETFYINVETFNTYDETRQRERIVVKRFFVTLDCVLIFEDENGNEYDWTEVTIYDLANILDKLNTIFK